jgi:hypothetical protein
VPPLRDPVLREPPLREPLLRDDPELRDVREPPLLVLRDVVLREVVLREPLLLVLRVPELRARVAAPFFAAWLRLVEVRLRVVAALRAACVRRDVSPLTRFSRSPSTEVMSSILRRTESGVRLSAAFPRLASSRATLFRIPLLRNWSNSFSSILLLCFAIGPSCSVGCVNLH